MRERHRPASVIVADDHPDVRGALIELFASDPRFIVIGSSPDEDGAVRDAALHQPTAAVLDGRMGPGGAASTVRRVRAASPRTVIVVHAAFASAGRRRALMEAGAAALIVKGDTKSDLVECVWSLI